MRARPLHSEAPSREETSSHPAEGRRFAERVALVTGASGGIGHAVVLALARHGLALGLLGRDMTRLGDTEAQARAAGARAAVALPIDFADPSLSFHSIASLENRLGEIDILIHSAGVYARGPMETAPIEALDALYMANLRGPYRLIQELLPLLRRRHGDIVLINSTQGLAATGAVGQYAATQHAFRAIADSLREEVNQAGIRVTVLHVGSTATSLQEGVCASIGRPYRPEQLLQPQDIASMVLAILMLPRSAEVTTMTIRPMRKP